MGAVLPNRELLLVIAILPSPKTRQINSMDAAGRLAIFDSGTAYRIGRAHIIMVGGAARIISCNFLLNTSQRGSKLRDVWSIGSVTGNWLRVSSHPPVFKTDGLKNLVDV